MPLRLPSLPLSFGVPIEKYYALAKEGADLYRRQAARVDGASCLCTDS